MSSIRTEQHVVQHFTHAHQLTKVDRFGEFTCDGCKTYGCGKTYRCAHCNYSLHDYCATCPPNLPSFMHPQHHLRLVTRGPPLTGQRMCDICHESVQGLFYQCEPCNFDVHPLCTRLPQHVTHVTHPAHPLELSPSGASNTCKVCSRKIRSWRYKCGPCRLDVHMECVDSAASATQRGVQQRDFGWQPQPQFYPYHQPYYNQYGYYNHGHTNQGQVQESSPGIGKRMFTLLMTLTIGVVCNIIAGPAAEALGGGF